MKAVLAIIVLTLVGRAYCIVKRQCNCFNAREFASRSCTGITEFDNLFTVSSTVSGVRGNITSFGSVLDKIAERTDKQSVINEICTSQNCFSRLEALYSCCSVDSSAGNGLTTRFNDVARDFACNRPSPTSLNYCANNINDVTTLMNDCALTNNQCNSRCAATLRRFRSSCCVTSYYELLTDEAQQRTLSQDIWNSCGITAPTKCSNSLVIILRKTFITLICMFYMLYRYWYKIKLQLNQQCFSPNFTATGQDTVVDNGGVYTVICRAEGEEEIRYKLLKDENEAFGFQSFGIFNLENIDGNNGGHYRCVASNECGTERSDVFIIYVQPRITITAPSGTKLIDTEKIDLQCTGNGYPEPIVQWIFNDIVIRSDNHLVISNLTTNDSGVYYCMGSSSVGSANESITITVFPVPTPTSSLASVTSAYITMTPRNATPTIISPGNNDDDSMSVAGIIVAVVGTLLLTIVIFIIIIITVMIVCRKRKKSRRTDDKNLTDQLPTISQQQSNNCDTLGARIDHSAGLETVNTLCMPNIVKSLNSLQQHINDSGVTGHDVIIAHNPSNSIDSYSLQSVKEPEHQYDYVQCNDDKVNEPTTSGSDPAESVDINPNPSYSLPQGDQDVKLEDNPSYHLTGYAIK